MATSTDPSEASGIASGGLVLDCSVLLPFYLEDERTEGVERLFARLGELDFWMPRLWRVEFVNALQTALRRGRLGDVEHRAALEQAERLPLQTDDRQLPLGELAELAARHALTAYDALYLELAQRRRLPLATLDKALRSAAPAAGVTLFEV